MGQTLTFKKKIAAGQLFAVTHAARAGLHSPPMKQFQIFKPGKHTASNGTTLAFSEDQLRAAVAAYDPALHEAPIVVGHPRDNGPAYGWIKSLSFADGAIEADPQQIDADFAEMVQAGRFKKRSASWYLPDSPNNPKPGTLYLRHVGFLGAQPPAVKGLRDVAFSDAEEGVIELGEWEDRSALGSIAGLLRGMREWLLAEKGADVADRVLPNYDIENVKRAYDAPPDPKEEPTPAGMPAFTEDDPMKIEELQAQVAELTAERDKLKATQLPADFAEREATLKQREDALAASQLAADRSAVDARVGAIVTAGRLLPAQRKHAADFAMSLAAGEAVIDFGEGDKAEKLTQREAYMRQLEAAPVAVNYGEMSGAAGGKPSEGAGDPQAVADKARDLVKTKQAEGKTMSFTEAVAEVMASDAA